MKQQVSKNQVIDKLKAQIQENGKELLAKQKQLVDLRQTIELLKNKFDQVNNNFQQTLGIKDQNMGKYVNDSNEKYNILYCRNLDLMDQLKEKEKLISSLEEKMKEAQTNSQEEQKALKNQLELKEKQIRDQKEAMKSMKKEIEDLTQELKVSEQERMDG